MKKSWRVYSILGVIGGMVIGGTSAALGLGTVAPKKAPEGLDVASNWGTLRDELNDGALHREVSADVVDILNGVNLYENLADAVEMSYAMARPDEIDLLDDLWLDTLIARADSATISRYLALRATIKTLPETGGNAYLDRWLWQVQASGTYDGNPGNLKPVGKSGENPNGLGVDVWDNNPNGETGSSGGNNGNNGNN